MSATALDERIEFRLQKQVKTKLKKASVVCGARNLSEYVARVAEEHADETLAKHAKMTLENDVFDEFIAACDNAEAPNQALLTAAELTRENGIE